MNLLYIGPYRQNDGWGEASKDLAYALSVSKLKVAIRPIYMANNISRDIDDNLKKLEQASYPSYDIVLQHVLPTMFDYSSGFSKNIGTFFSETNHLEYTPWPNQCNMMDEIWVSSETERKNLINSHVTKPIRKINVPTNTNKFEQSYQKIGFPFNGESFNFYFIGEYIERKNLPALLLAFHLEFGPQEPVNLVIKTSIGGLSTADAHGQVEHDIYKLKESFAIYRTPNDYKREVIITDYLSNEQLYGLHKSCHCFVMPSRGEAWCRPAFDAMGFGNPAIVTDNTGMTEFVSDENGWLVKSNEAPVLCINRPINYLYRGRETWQNIDILALRKAMREAYNNRTLFKQKKQAAIQTAYNYSYSKIADQINESC